MPKKILTWFFFLILILSSVNAVTLHDFNLVPNPAFETQTVEVFSEISLPQTLDATNTGSGSGITGAKYNYFCQSFKAETDGIFNDFWFSSVNGATSLYENGTLLEYVDLTTAGAILNTSTGDSVAREADGGGSTWYGFDNFDTNNVYVYADNNYWFCFAGDNAPAGYTNINFGQNNPYANGIGIFNIFDANLASGDFSDQLPLTNNGDYKFRLYIENLELVKLQCGTAPSTYNLCSSEEFQYTINPSCSFTNTFSGETTNPVYCSSFSDTNTSNEISKNLTTVTPLYDKLSCTAISNVENCTVDFNAIYVTPLDKTEPVNFSVNNLTSGAVFYDVIVKNPLKDGRQYFVQSSTDGVNYSFDDTFTYGALSFYDEPIQKVYKPSLDEYQYQQLDLVFGSQKNYYIFEYEQTSYFWDSMYNNSDWDIQLSPQKTDVNGITKDIYQISSYSNIRNVFLEKIVDVSSNFNDNVLFQLNAKYQSEQGQNLQVGEVLPNGTDNTTNYSIAKNEKRYNFIIEPDFALLKTSNNTASSVILGEYAIINRGYFTKNLEIKTEFNEDLPLALNDNNTFTEYLLEGQKFRIDSEVIDLEGRLDYYEVIVYIDVVNDGNAVAYYRYEFDSDEDERVQLNDLINGVFDLTANAPSRNIKILLRVVDEDGQYSEIQSRWLTMFQFPYFPDDLRLNVTQNNRIIGTNPEGSLELDLKNTDLLRGVKLTIYDSNSDNNFEYGTPDYNIILYKDVDFSCSGFSCSFNYKLNRYIFPSSDAYRIVARALVTTEYDNSSNTALTDIYPFYIGFKDWETARIFQIIERADSTYNNIEPIGVALQLRNGTKDNLQNDLVVSLNVTDCGANPSGACAGNLTNYSWDRFVYDDETGYNYWFFRKTYTNLDGSLLTNGNYYRFSATITDASNQHQTSISPLLTKKCHNNDADIYIPTMFNMNNYNFGCKEYAPAIVSTATNSADENRIFIDVTETPTPPTQEVFVCMSPNNQNLYKDSLRQPLYCAVVYTVGESTPNNAILRITNENSDLSEKNDEYKQFIEYKTPYDLLFLNDLELLKRNLALSQDAEINTVGEGLIYGFNEIFAGFANPLGDLVEGLQTITFNDGNNIRGLIVNSGADFNFDKLLSPANVSGIIFYKIDGVGVINYDDYKYNDELNNIPLKQFVKYAKQNNERIAEPTTKITVYTSNWNQLRVNEIQSNLVINEPQQNIEVNRENLDTNENFTEVPRHLRFNLIHDLTYYNELQSLRAFIPFSLVTIIKSNLNILDEFLNTINEILAGNANPIDVLISYIFENILIITIIIMLLIVGVYIGVVRGYR